MFADPRYEPRQSQYSAVPGAPSLPPPLMRLGNGRLIRALSTQYRFFLCTNLVRCTSAKNIRTHRFGQEEYRWKVASQ